jgi:hypothetical protein
MLGSVLGSDLRRLIGSDAVLTDEAARALAGTDFITQRGVPAAVARPTSVDQVAALLSYAAEHGVRIIPRGAATNLSAAIAPGDDSLVLVVMLRLDLAVPIRDDVYGQGRGRVTWGLGTTGRERNGSWTTQHGTKPFSALQSTSQVLAGRDHDITSNMR